MSFSSEECKLRLEACERDISEIKQNAVNISLALLKLTHVVDVAVQGLDTPDAPEGSE